MKSFAVYRRSIIPFASLLAVAAVACANGSNVYNSIQTSVPDDQDAGTTTKPSSTGKGHDAGSQSSSGGTGGSGTGGSGTGGSGTGTGGSGTGTGGSGTGSDGSGTGTGGSGTGGTGTGGTGTGGTGTGGSGTGGTGTGGTGTGGTGTGGSGTGGTGTGGTGTGGSGSTCTPMMQMNDPTCDKCAGSSCCEPMNDFAQSPSSQTFLTCAQTCLSASTSATKQQQCLDTCTSKYPTASSNFDIFADCLSTSCSVECPAN